jgi:hypothetical protein
MTSLISSLLFAAVLALSLSLPAQAQLARTFVSSLGSDGNTCGRLDPCRTFQVAHDNTLANGEITVLDPGGYGAVTITKSISIINDGVGEAGVLVSGGLTGIRVNAADSDVVSLRGLTIKGIGFGGGNGITFARGAALTVENCAIRTLDGTGRGFGLRFEPLLSARLAVLNTIVADNQSTAIRADPDGRNRLRVTLSRVQLINNNAGLDAGTASSASGTGIVDVVVENSLVLANSVTGLRLVGPAGNTRASLLLIRSVVAHGAGVAIEALGAQATLRVGQSGITGNRVSWNATGGGVVQSYGDNNINANADGDPAIPTVIATK